MGTNDVRIFPEQRERVETGVIRFGDDWPGVFIRGDNAAHFAMTLSHYMAGNHNNVIDAMVLNGLLTLLESCIEQPKEQRHG